MNEDNFRVQPSQKDGYSRNCIPCQIEYNHNRYMENREKEIEAARQWKLNNYEKYRESKRKYQSETARGKEVIRKAGEKFRQTDKYTEWQNNNKDRLREYNEKRQHKNHKVTKEEWLACKEYFNNNCVYCGLSSQKHYIRRKNEIKLMDLHKEHVDHQGNNDLSNCVPSCQRCNSSKGSCEFNEWYNESNPIFTLERHNKVIQWIIEDHLKYISVD